MTRSEARIAIVVFLVIVVFTALAFFGKLGNGEAEEDLTWTVVATSHGESANLYAVHIDYIAPNGEIVRWTRWTDAETETCWMQAVIGEPLPTCAFAERIE